MNQPGPARPKVFQQLLSFVLAARNAFFSPTAGLQRTACVVVGQAHVGHMGREERKGRLTSLCLCFHVCQSKGLTGWQNRFLSLSLSFSFYLAICVHVYSLIAARLLLTTTSESFNCCCASYSPPCYLLSGPCLLAIFMLSKELQHHDHRSVTSTLAALQPLHLPSSAKFGMGTNPEKTHDVISDLDVFLD